MKHLHAISRQAPALAQFEPVLQFIALLQSVLGLLQSIEDVFGITIFDKDNAPAD